MMDFFFLNHLLHKCWVKGFYYDFNTCYKLKIKYNNIILWITFQIAKMSNWWVGTNKNHITI